MSNDYAAKPADNTAHNLLVRLSNYGKLGWILATIFAFLFFLSLFIQLIRPQAVIAVDERGNILGTFEYLDGTARSDGEILASLKRWADARFSVNSSTIYNDIAFYLSMSSDELYEREKEELEKLMTPITIEEAGTTSRIEWDLKNTSVLKRKGNIIEARLVGALVIGQKSATRTEFDVGLTGRVVPRSQLKTSGIKVDNWWYN